MGAFSGSLGSVFVDIDGDLSKLQASLRKALPEAQKAGEEISRAVAQGTRVTSVGEYFSNLGGALQNFRNVSGQALKDLQAFTPGLDRFGAAASSLGSKLSIGVTLPLAGLATASIRAAADMDSLERGLTAVAGSTAAAQAQLKELREVAKLPGLGLKEAVEGSVRLQAFGFSAGEAKSALLAFGNAIATVGGGKQDLDRVIVQLGQMAGAGKVLTQDLRPIIQTVPQVAGIIKKEFGEDALSDPAKAIEKLGLTSKEAIAIIVRELGRLPQVTGGLKNDLENFQDAVFEAFAKIGKELTPFVQQFTTHLVPAIQTAVKVFTDLPGPVKTAAIEFGIFAVVLGPIIGTVGQMVSGLSALIKVLGPLATSMTAVSTSATAAEVSVGRFNTVLKTAGYVAIAISLYELAAAYANVTEATGLQEKAERSELDSLQILAMRLKAHGVDITDLADKYRQGLISYDEYAKKLREIAILHGNEEAIDRKLIATRTGLSRSAQEIVKDQREADEAVKVSRRSLEELQAALGRHEVSAGAVARAQRELEAAITKANGPIKTQFEIIDQGVTIWDTAAMSALMLSNATAEAESHWADLIIAGQELTEQMLEFDSAARKAANATALLQDFAGRSQIETLAFNLRIVTGEVDNLAGSLPKLLDPFGNLGIKSQRELQRLAESARDSYESIARRVDSTTLDIQRAWVKMIEAQIAAGAQLSPAVRKEYEKIKDSVDGNIRKMSEWLKIQQEFVQSARQASNFLAGGIAQSIVGFDRNAFNRQLDEQTADQNQALAERESAHAEHVAKLTAQLNEIVKKNKGRVTQEELDVRDALAKENAEYAKFRDQTLQKLKEIQDKHRTAWKDIQEAIHQTAIRAAEDLLQIMIRKGLDLVLDRLSSILKIIPGIGKGLSGIASTIATPPFFGGNGSLISQLPVSIGGGTGGLPPIGGVGGGTGGAGVGGAAGVASGGTLGAVLGIVTGAISAASSIVGNFQQAHANTALGRIEESTRFIKIAFLGSTEPAVLKISQIAAEAEKSYWGTTVPLWTRILTELESINTNTRGGGNGAGTVIINVNGGDPRQTLETISTYLRPLGYRYQTA